MSLQLWTDCRVATLQAGASQPYGLIEDAVLVVGGESIVWVGPRTDAPAELLARCTVQHLSLIHI